MPPDPPSLACLYMHSFTSDTHVTPSKNPGYEPVYCIWPQANKHVRTYTHTHAQCSLASVGITQARPNYNLTKWHIAASKSVGLPENR